MLNPSPFLVLLAGFVFLDILSATECKDSYLSSVSGTYARHGDGSTPRDPDLLLPPRWMRKRIGWTRASHPADWHAPASEGKQKFEKVEKKRQMGIHIKKPMPQTYLNNLDHHLHRKPESNVLNLQRFNGGDCLR